MGGGRPTGSRGGAAGRECPAAGAGAACTPNLTERDGKARSKTRKRLLSLAEGGGRGHPAEPGGEMHPLVPTRPRASSTPAPQRSDRGSVRGTQPQPRAVGPHLPQGQGSRALVQARRPRRGSTGRRGAPVARIHSGASAGPRPGGREQPGPRLHPQGGRSLCRQESDPHRNPLEGAPNLKFHCRWNSRPQKHPRLPRDRVHQEHIEGESQSAKTVSGGSGYWKVTRDTNEQDTCRQMGRGGQPTPAPRPAGHRDGARALGKACCTAEQLEQGALASKQVKT